MTKVVNRLYHAIHLNMGIKRLIKTAKITSWPIPEFAADAFGNNRHRLVPLLARTPCFVINRAGIESKRNELEQALSTYWGKNAVIAYSYKTNYEPVHQHILTPNTVWLEVVSGNEYTNALKQKFPGSHIIFNGPYKTQDDIARALRHHSLIHIDNEEELQHLLAVTRKQKRQSAVGIRLRIATSRFGFSRKDAIRAVQTIAREKSLRMTSVHMHIGTDIDDVERYKNATAYLANFVNEIEPLLGYEIATLDVGGGFPSSTAKPYDRMTSWQPLPIKRYINTIAATLTTHLVHKDKQLIVEPGRFLVDEAVMYCTSVLHCFTQHAVQHVVTNGTTTAIPLAQYRPQIVGVCTPSGQPKTTGRTMRIIEGATCREQDILHEGVIPSVRPGDIICYFAVGAYNQSLGSPFIFGPTACFVI